jgi:hypothetical protein
MKKRPSSEGNSRLFNEDIPRVLLNQGVQRRPDMCPTFVCILNLMKPVASSCDSKMHFNIIIQQSLIFLKQCVPFLPPD